MPKVHMVSFADRRLHKSLTRLKNQAQLFGFSSINLMNETHLSTAYVRDFNWFLNDVNMYLCAWKPQVALQVMSKIEDGDYLFYTDVGSHLNAKGIKRFSEYIDMMESDGKNLLVSELDLDNPESRWTKGDVLRYFGIWGNEKAMNLPHLQATFFIVRKCPEIMSFFQKWKEIFLEHPELVFRDKGQGPNALNFEEHRSDQSFFSLLAKQTSVISIDAKEVQGSAAWETDMIDFPIWAKRDKVWDHSFWARPSFTLLKRTLVKKILGKR
ncbi:MAG: hypothetical protein ACI9YL_000088 [Luteibaculaceae bacterium]|jgi:hypothetical protein